MLDTRIRPMFEKITVFDIETPDKLNSRICSIGITRIENGEIIGSENFLIDPECEFNHINMRINHIHPEDVLGKPTFPEFWENYGAYFEDGIVAGYNISASDLPTLRKTMKAYGVEIEPFNYIDILFVAKDAYPDLPNHRLPTLCESLDISLEHHDSGSDSLAEAGILLDILGKYDENELSEYVKTFDLNETTNSKKSNYSQHEAMNLSRKSKALRALKEAIEEMTKDGAIKYEDFESLHEVVESYYLELFDTYPFGDLYNKIDSIIEDGKVTQEELDDFTQFCKIAFNPVENSQDQFDGVVEGKYIVLTGDFAFSPNKKEPVKKKLEEAGAIIQERVTQKTDVVIVGKLGSPHWKMGTFGDKVEKAKEYQGKGCPIKIIMEENMGDFWKS